MICQKKNKRLIVFCLSFLLFCLAVIPCLFSVQSYASETSTQSVTDYFREHNFYDTAAYVCRKYASFPYLDYTTGSSSGITYDAWADWLESKGKSSLLDEDVIITGTSGGRGYDIPQDVRQEMLNFVQEVYIDQNSLSYTKAYIYSYNFVNATWFPNYQMYASFKTWSSQQNGYILTTRYVSGGNTRGLYCRVIPKTNAVNFVGTVTEGSFTNVALYIGWSTSNSPWNLANDSSLVRIELDGTVNTNVTNGDLASTVGNTANPYDGTSSRMSIFSNLEKNEMVYVFNTLNALKNYNANADQPYYMPTNVQTTVPYYDGFTDSQLASAGNFYNNITINTDGLSPNEKQKKTDSILGSLDGIFGDSDSESSSGGLFDSLGDIITGVTGAISPIKEIVLGDIKDLVADVFDFLPPTIITLWVSGIIFGIFFGVLKLIRG